MISENPASPAQGDPFAPPAARPADRDAVPQYVLPLVVRVERGAPPARTAALEAAARAVLTFLADPRATEAGGAWHETVRAWTDGRIRKVVRRARGAEWRRACALDGLTVEHDGAEVRVHPPVPLDGWPRDLARLQVSGTDFGDPAPPGAPAPGTAVLWLNPGLEMSAGKAMAQAGHAAQLAWLAMSGPARARWAAEGFPLAVRVADPARWEALAASGLPTVRDAGFTEIAPGSRTVVAEVPGAERDAGPQAGAAGR